MELRGVSAVVTGAGRGIGRAIALSLAGAGVRVLGVSRTHAELDALAEQARGGPGEVLGHVADLRDPGAAEAVVAAAAAAFGGLRILVNNAGLGAQAPLAETSDETWDAVIGTNLSAVFRLTRAALPHLTRKGGHVLMISSLAGRNAIAGMSAYCASKAALDHLAACLMLEVRHQGVKVTTIAPGSVDTSFGSTAGLGEREGSWRLQAEDVAGTVLDLLRMRDDAHASRIEMRPLRPRSG